MAEPRTAVALVAILTLPGWALLATTGYWRSWRGLQRWCVALGLSIAFWPALQYWTRFVAPGLGVGTPVVVAVLGACALAIAWRLRGHTREQLRFDRLEWAAIGVFALTLFTRFWVVRGDPYPAWSDSLHHAILTQMTTALGRLPTDMQPYFPISLEQYHLGLYALSSVVQRLGRIPAHEAMLYAAQVLSGLCGVGVYLALDRRSGRLGAVVGAAIVGLLSHQPSLYVNWGRFTQLASQTVLLVSWIVTWEALAAWRRSAPGARGEIAAATTMGALLSAGVFLLHFRVAVFYLPLVAAVAAWEMWLGRRDRRALRVAAGAVAVAVGAALVAWPALWDAGRVYVERRLSQPAAPPATPDAAETRRRYYEFPWSSVPLLAAREWLLVVAGASAVLGLLRRNRLTVLSIGWLAVLVAMGQAYALDVPLIRFTNMGAVLVLLYLPIGLVVGVGAQEVIRSIRPERRSRAEVGLLAAVLAACLFGARARATEIEPYRHFLTPADVTAMQWIRDNTPPDALFAVNTTFWLPRATHGTDGGYWIPYFTGRATTAGAMIQSEADPEYQARLVEMGRAEERLAAGEPSLPELERLGVDYVYVGPKGDFSEPGLDPERLGRIEGLRRVYARDGVTIFEIE